MTMPPVAEPDAATSARYSTLFRRIAAGIVDGGLFFAAYELVSRSAPGGEVAWYACQLGFGFGWIAYALVMTRCYGGTLGKLALGVRVFDLRETAYPTFRQLVVRDLYWIISLLVIAAATTWRLVRGVHPVWAYDYQFEQTCADMTWSVIDALCALSSLKRRALHDLMAGTVVVVVRGDKPAAPPVMPPTDVR